MIKNGSKNPTKISIKNKILLLIILPIIFTNISFISALYENNPEFPSTTLTERVEESLDRGLVAMNNSEGDIYLSWRLLEDDPADIEFDIYRSNQTHPSSKLNSAPISITTDFVDSFPGISIESEYWVVSRVNNVELSTSKKVSIENPAGKPYISIPLQGNYTAGKLGVGDLNGDGEYDFIVKTPNEGTDPANSAWKPAEGTHKLEAYLSNGTFLWSYDMGWDIEMGTWFGPYVVYDLDSDGKAEVIVKSGDGDHRDLEGRVASGSEYAKVLDGMTGEEITRAPWISRWFGTYKNLARNQMGIAYLNGINPYLIVARGTYGFMTVKAYLYQNQQLTEIWHWESSYEWGYHYYSEGAHTMKCYDIDNDGKDEVILGSCVLDETGNGLWSTGFTHCDLAYLGDLDPTHPGLEMFYAIEGTGQIEFENGYGLCMVDAATGKMLWALNSPTKHMHGGVVSDITAQYEGMECYAAEKSDPERYLLSPQGDLIAREDEFDGSTGIRALYWDANIQRELFLFGDIRNYDSQETYMTELNGNANGFMDILGDWREELLMTVNGELRIYISTIPAIDRRDCLMQDKLYRTDVAHNSMGYPHVPTTSYCLAAPDAELIPSSTWISNNQNEPTNSTRIAAFIRKYNITILSYFIALILTSIFLIFDQFQKKLMNFSVKIGELMKWKPKARKEKIN